MSTVRRVKHIRSRSPDQITISGYSDDSILVNWEACADGFNTTMSLHGPGIHEIIAETFWSGFVIKNTGTFPSGLVWITDNEPVGAFDFNKNGRIDFSDIVTLFNGV